MQGSIFLEGWNEIILLHFEAALFDRFGRSSSGDKRFAPDGPLCVGQLYYDHAISLSHILQRDKWNGETLVLLNFLKAFRCLSLRCVMTRSPLHV